MVQKRRPTKGMQTLSDPQTHSLSLVCEESTLMSIIHNVNAIHQDLAILDLENSLLFSSHLPILDVDAGQIKHGRQSNFPLPSISSRTISRVSNLQLPRSIVPHFSNTFSQHYVFIPDDALYHSEHSMARGNDLAALERSDGKFTIAMEAKREATVIKKVNKLIRRGLWSRNRLPKVMEPCYLPCQWDYLLEEACWLAEDFRQERIWKKAVAKKLAFGAKMFCMIRSELAERLEEELEDLRRRGAAMVAKIVRHWWSGVSQIADSVSFLSEQRQWREALLQNRVFLTHFTDVGSNGIFESSRSLTLLPPTQKIPLMPNMTLEEQEGDSEWLPPESSSTNGSLDSVVSKEADFNPDSFSWGLQSHPTLPVLQLDSSFSEDSSDDKTFSSKDSSATSKLSTDQEDVPGLIFEAVFPLNEVLETYLSNGWSIQPPVTESHPRGLRRDASLVDKESHYQSIVNALRQDAMLPLRQLLPPGYHPISSGLGLNGPDSVIIRRRQPLRRSSRPALVNGCSPHNDMEVVLDGVLEDDVETEGEVKSETSAGADSMEIDGCPSDSEVSIASLPNTVTGATEMPTISSFLPSELARRARGLVRSRTQIASRHLLQSRLPAFGPTCRVPFLPTSNLFSGVSWLGTTYSHQVPTCLVTYSTPSAEAEICLAAHIGRLAAVGARGNGVGDWGPHLLVCPRVLLPAWRARLTSVCPGLRVFCVLANSRGGTGRRLKSGIARQIVHICLTTYSALKSRPSRFEGVQWHLVILDQVQHLINPSAHFDDKTSAPYTTISDQSSSVINGGGTANEALTTNFISRHSTLGIPIPDLVRLILCRLLPSAHQRVCIFTDLCEPQTAHLKILLSLLLYSPSIANEIDASVIEEIVWQASLIRSDDVSTVSTRDEVMRSLEPFLYRFADDEEDEDEDESVTRSGCRIEDLFRTEVISDHLTNQQRVLHDRILTDKACERAVRSGHLTDLLTCLSAGSRVCCHPLLLGNYVKAIHRLAQDRQPGFSPPLLIAPGLRFDSSKSLLALRDPNSEIAPLLHLSSSLQAPAHVRSRLVKLLPNKEKLKQALADSSLGDGCSGCALTPKRPRLSQEIGTMEEEPFLAQDALQTMLLQPAKALFTKASTESMTFSKARHNTELTKLNGSTARYSALSVDVENRFQQLLWQYQRTHLELDGYADWCCAATMDRIHTLTREPSLLLSGVHVFPALPFIEVSTSTLCRVVQEQYEQLPPLSSSFGLLCTRDRVSCITPQLTDPFSCPSTLAETEAIIDRFYPLLPSSRWLSSHTIPHHLPQFIAASGKIQRLRRLLLDFIRSPPPPLPSQLMNRPMDQRSLFRPRVIFILSHRAAFLDLLATWLSVDPHLSSIALFRAPIDYLDADCTENASVSGGNVDGCGSDGGKISTWVEQVNAWPCGTQGPLFVLLHARSPPFSVAGLQAGPDTRLVICDADWRKDVVSAVKSKLRCWSINGLVDVPPEARFPIPFPPLLHAYHLVTELDNGDSVEARLVKSTAVQLLPSAVFMTSSPSAASRNTDSALPPPSRVQPNVVQQLVSCLRRRALWRCNSGLPLSQSTDSMPPLDSDGVEGEDATTTPDEESDNASLFHNREPIRKELLMQFFDLHEAPRDVKAWSSALTESTAIVTEMHSNDQTSRLDVMLSSPILDDILSTSDLDSCCVVSHNQPVVNLAPPGALETWELDEASWRENLQAIEEITMDQEEPPFYLHPAGIDGEDVIANEFADENDLPIVDPFKLPLWVPSFFEDPEFLKYPLPAPFDTFDPSTNSTIVAAQPRSPFWGYATEAMTEGELPPLPTAVAPLFDSTNTTATRSTGDGSAPSVPPPFKTDTVLPAVSYALKRSAAATLSARSSVGVSSGGAVAPPTKKRKLTGAAAMAARRAASNKAAAAAAAATNSCAVVGDDGGRLSHFEGNEKLLLEDTTLDRSDHISPTSSSTTSAASVNASTTATTAITPTAVSTSFTVTLSPSQKVSIPRTFFSRDLRAIAGGVMSIATNPSSSIGSGGAGATGALFNPAARIRRVVSSASGTNSARSGSLGAGSTPALAGGATGSAAGILSALNNPHLLAKYAIPSIGKSTASTSLALASSQRQSLHAPSGLATFKVGSSSTACHLQPPANDTKQPEWSPLEEAALLMCTINLQGVPFAGGGNSHPHAPHHHPNQSIAATTTTALVPSFRLVEFFLNNYIATRAYRSCRQCLLAYYRILSTLMTSSAADLLPPHCDDDKSGSVYAHHLHHHNLQQHGSPTGIGRKVKNKLKSGLSAPLLSTSSASLLGHGNYSVSGVTIDPNTAAASSANKLKGYQFYLYLQSQLASTSTASAQLSGGSTTNAASAISPLDHQVISLFRKCIRDAATKPSSSSNLHHHHHYPSASTPASSHLPQSQAHQRMGGPATAATMLMRNAAATTSASSLQASSQPPSGGPVIQKNPSHIAALHEHNISPDTIFTPAMVIKSKEEREARQRSDAVAAAATASSSSLTSSNVSSVSVVATSTPSASGSPAIVSSASHTGLLPATRVHPHSHQQHPTIVTLSGTGSPGGGSTIQRSANILPFSAATSVSYHGCGSAPPTVFRYTTPVSMGTAAQQVSSTTTAAPTSILRRVGSSVVSGNAQSVFAVTSGASSSAARVISNTGGGTTMMRRGVTLTSASGASLAAAAAGGSAGASNGGTAGVAVLATTSGVRPASVIYHHQTSAPAGFTLLPAGAQPLPQIIRPRQQFRPTTTIPSQRFVRTLSATPTTTTTLVHRTRDGMFTSPVQQQQLSHQRGSLGGGAVVVPESQLLRSRIHPVSGTTRRPATAMGSTRQHPGQPSLPHSSSPPP